MTFVQVKENAYLDLDRGISIEIEPVNNEFVLSIDHVRTVYTTSYRFPTLEEAIAAQKRIIESCGMSLNITSQESEKLITFLRYLREDQNAK